MLLLKLPKHRSKRSKAENRGKKEMLKGLYSYRKMTWMCSEVQKVGEQGTGGSRF